MQSDTFARRMLSGWLSALAITALILFSVPVTAANGHCPDGPFQIRQGTDHHDLTTCIWYLEDSSRELSLTDVMGRSDDFRQHSNSVLNFGYTRSAYWIRFDLDYRTGTRDSDHWLLELALPLADEARLYLVNEAGEVYYQRSLKYSMPWEERDLAVPNPVFSIDLIPDEVTQVYLRVFTENTLRAPLHLWSTEAYTHKVSVEEWIQGIFIGAMLALLAYNLFVIMVVRESGYVFYVIYIFFAVQFVTTEQVHGLQVFSSLPPWLDKAYLHYYIQATWFFALLMARELLDTRKRSKPLDQLLQLGLKTTVLTFLLSLLVDYHVAMQWTVIGSVMMAVLMIGISFSAWRQNLPSAGIYFFSWLCTLSGVGFYGMAVMGFFPLNDFTAHAPQIGFVTQIILLSLAFANRIKVVQREALEWNQRAVSNLKRYRALFDNAIEGIFQMSTNCRFLDANPSMAKMMGYSSPRELIRHVPDALKASFAEMSVRHWVIRQLEREGTVHAVEGIFRTRQGEERWANVSIRTIYDEEGAPSHLEGTFVDVTERKHREQVERERENERLEKEIARNSAASKSQFLANMSHEIRTPLAAIIGYGETLMEPDLSDDEKQNSAETVVRSGRHLLELINDILDHSKIDANKLDVEILSVNLPELLDEVRAFFTPRAREKGLDFQIQCEYPLPETIRTDPTRFRQILINLCGNALKFTEKGSIHIGIRCDRERERLIARVVDTGIGMKPDQLERLFDPFAQATAAIARQYGGTGLGLSISKRLAELLGGDIRADSTWGEGSEFEVSIASGPLGEVHFIRDGSEMTHRRRRLPMVEAPRLSGRILCAEDNEVNRRLVNLLVTRTGASIEHVGNGAEALEKATTREYDLVLMDIQMPVMNGRDATKAIRDAGVNVPIIALTANVMTEDLHDYREAGCNDFLAKPIDKRRFYEALARYLTVESDGRSQSLQFAGTVLVAEDNRDSSRLVKRLLERFGVTVEVAETGTEAVRKAMSGTVHLVLMDSHMPEMDGTDATRMLRQTGFRRPVIAFTAGDDAEIEALQEAGCDGVLNKPIDTAQLRVLLQKYLGTLDESDTVIDPTLDEGIQELVGQFLDGLPERLQIMQESLDSEDWMTLQTQAHQIKGTAGAMGYPLMTERAAALERALKNQDADEARTLFPELARLIRQALETRR